MNDVSYRTEGLLIGSGPVEAALNPWSKIIFAATVCVGNEHVVKTSSIFER